MERINRILIVGVEMGDDDYLVKPLNPRELLARIKSAKSGCHACVDCRRA